MEEKVYPLKLNYDYSIELANDIIKGKQSMTNREAQLLYITLSNIVKQDKELKTYRTTVTELADFMGIDPDSLYDDLKDICKKLRSRTVEVQIGGNNSKGKAKWKVFGWIDSAEYDRGTLTIRLSEALKPYVIALTGFFTSVPLYRILTFKYYAGRFYQYLWCERNENNREVKCEWEFTIERIREIFQLDTKKIISNKDGKKIEVYAHYTQPRDLLKNIIIPALRELNASPYFCYWGYEEKKARTKGNPLVSIKFNAEFFDSQAEKDRFIEGLEVDGQTRFF